MFSRYSCTEEILTITAMLSVNNSIFYRPKVIRINFVSILIEMVYYVYLLTGSDSIC